MLNLSELEKREVQRLLRDDEPLPEKYRFLLFADKREVDLVRNGKDAEVCKAVLTDSKSYRAISGGTARSAPRASERRGGWEQLKT